MSPITLGILAASGAASVGSYELITSTVLSSSAASVTFSNLGTAAAAYKHLQIRMVVLNSANSTLVRYNSDSTNGNYRSHGLYGVSGSVTSEDVAWARAGGLVASPEGFSTSDPNAAILDVLDWQGSKNKTGRTLSGRGSGAIMLASHVWLSTAAITSIQLLSNGANPYLTGSRFSLYGLRG